MQMIETLIELLKIRSFTGEEKNLCDYLQNYITKLNPELNIRRIDNSLVIFSPFQANRKTLGFAGHLDTVPGDGYGENVKVEADRIIGLGASDMKSGLAIMLELLKPENLKNSQYNLIQIFYCAEEGPNSQNHLHVLLKEVAEIKKIDLCFVLEPTDNTLQLGCLGSIYAEITFKGKSAHSARPWQGENAIHKAAEFITKISKLSPKIVNDGGLEFKEVASITTANGGKTRNVIPDSFAVCLNIRYSALNGLENAKAWLNELVAGQAQITMVDISPACPVPATNPILNKFQSVFQLPQQPKQAYTDVALFAEIGVPAINCGPGLTAQCHQKGEYVLISDLEKSAKMFKEFLSF